MPVRRQVPLVRARADCGAGCCSCTVQVSTMRSAAAECEGAGAAAVLHLIITSSARTSIRVKGPGALAGAGFALQFTISLRARDGASFVPNPTKSIRRSSASLSPSPSLLPSLISLLHHSLAAQSPVLFAAPPNQHPAGPLAWRRCSLHRAPCTVQELFKSHPGAVRPWLTEASRTTPVPRRHPGGTSTPTAHRQDPTLLA